MKNKVLKFIKSKKALYLFIFITMLVLFYFMPYQGDDWEWGSSFGIENLKNYFRDFNGRYLGNLLIVTMSRFRILRSIITTGSLFLIVFLLKKTFGFKRDVELYLIIILLLCMDSMIMSQAIAWSSGFANYVPPAIIFLTVIYINRKAFENEKYSLKASKIFPLFLLGIAGSLFAEHMTIYNLLLSIFLVIYNRIKQKKFIIANVFYMVGSFLGTILMFSNGGYYRILKNADEYRDIVPYNDIVSRVIYGYFGKIYKPYILNQIVLSVVLGIIIFIIGRKFLEEKQLKEKVRNIVKTILSIVLLFNVYILAKSVLFQGELSILNNIRIFEGLLSGLYLISIAVFLFLVIKDKPLKRKLLFLLFSSAVMVSPLLFVSPVGSRCFLPIYVTLTALVTLLFKHIIDEKYINVKHPEYIKSIMIILFIIFTIIYTSIIKVDQKRLNHIKEVKNQNVEKMFLPKLPFSKYHWNGNPYDEGFVEQYKIFYGIDKNINVEFIPYPEWKKIRR